MRPLSRVLAALPVMIAGGIILPPPICDASEQAQCGTLVRGSLEAAVDQLLQPLVNDDLISGSILIAVDGEIVLAKGYGLANREREVPNQPDTRFRIGSVTKLFTALMVMQLEERGILSLEDPVEKYVPGYPNGDQITLEHLLTHTSGIRSYIYLPEYGSRRLQPHTLDQIVDWFASAPLEFEPGTRFQYSNSNSVLLARVIELVSGMSYSDCLHQYVLKPAGMTATGVDTAGLLLVNRADGYSRQPFGPVTEATDMRVRPFGVGDGDLYSTVMDLYRWDRALDARLLLSDAATERMWEPVVTTGGGFRSRGWVVDEHFGHRSVTHGGSIAGFLSRFRKFPDDGILVVTCFNIETLLAQDVEQRLTAIVLGQPFEPFFSEVTREAHLDAFADRQGKYNIDDGQDLVLSIDDGRLYARYTTEEADPPYEVRGPRYEAHILSSDRAFVKETNAILTFRLAEDGETPALTAYEGLIMWQAQRYARPMRGRLDSGPLS